MALPENCVGWFRAVNPGRSRKDHSVGSLVTVQQTFGTPELAGCMGAPPTPHLAL